MVEEKSVLNLRFSIHSVICENLNSKCEMLCSCRFEKINRPKNQQKQTINIGKKSPFWIQEFRNFCLIESCPKRSLILLQKKRFRNNKDIGAKFYCVKFYYLRLCFYQVNFHTSLIFWYWKYVLIKFIVFYYTCYCFNLVLGLCCFCNKLC